MTLHETIRLIEAATPLRTQDDWDNSGWQIRQPDTEVTGILLSLDVTEAVIDEAAALGCNLLITHHPLLFGKIRTIGDEDETSVCIRKALQHHLAVYSAHTTLDRMQGGVSWFLAGKLQLTDVKLLETAPDGLGYGVIGHWEQPRPLDDALRTIRDTFAVQVLRYHAPATPRPIQTVAVCSGSGAFLAGEALRQGADLYLTGDLKHHDWRTGGERMTLVDMGHFESEQCTKEIFFNLLSKKIPNFAIHFASQDKNPIQIFT